MHKCVYHKMETAQWQSNYCNTIASCNGLWLNAEVHYSSLRFMINKNAQMCLSWDGNCTMTVFIAILLPVVNDRDKMLKYIVAYHSLWLTTLHKRVYHKMDIAQWQSIFCNTIASR